MGSVTLKSLVLAGSLVQLLPSGWCSIVTLPGVGGGNEAPKKDHGGCCDLCHCKDREKPPPEPSRPLPPPRCCCYELDWLKPPSQVKVEVDISFVVFLVPSDRLAMCGVLQHRLDVSTPVPSPPLQILKCVWLC